MWSQVFMNDSRSGVASLNQQAVGEFEHHESYFELVWRRFRRSPASIVGGLMVVALCILAIFADFFSPTPIDGIDLKSSFIPPQQVHFIDAAGKFHMVPFVYNYGMTLDPQTFKVTWTEDTGKLYEIGFLIQGSEYKLLGLIPSNLHLFGVAEGGSLHILGTDKMGRD